MPFQRSSLFHILWSSDALSCFTMAFLPRLSFVFCLCGPCCFRPRGLLKVGSNPRATPVVRFGRVGRNRLPIIRSPDHPITRFPLKRFPSLHHLSIWGRPSQLRITSRARFRLGRSHEEFRAIGPSDLAANGVNMRLKSQWWGFLILSIFGKRSGVGSADSRWD